MDCLVDPVTNGFLWFQIAQVVIMAVVGLLVFTAMRAFKAGQWTQTIDHSADLAKLEARLDHAGRRMSDLSATIQALPDVLRQIFVSRELFDARLEESLRDRHALRDEIDKLRNGR